MVLCQDNPIVTDGSDWLNNYVGRISVGKKREDGTFEIYAYSDNDSESNDIRKIAKDIDGFYIRSLDNGGVTAID